MLLLVTLGATQTMSGDSQIQARLAGKSQYSQPSAPGEATGEGGKMEAREQFTQSLDLGYTLTVGLLTNGLSC